MSGDNMHGKQPLKFYSECLTLTKISLIDHLINENYKASHHLKLEDKLKDWKKLLAD